MSLDDLVGAGEAIRAEAAERHPRLAPARLAGVGWATVESERAAAELAAVIGRRDVEWASTNRDALLGASAQRLVGGGDGEPAVLLLEPDTEGRLAASLARFGEGVAAIYIVADSAPDDAIGRPEVGALGPGRLLLGRPAWGPHVIVLVGDSTRPDSATRP